RLGLFLQIPDLNGLHRAVQRRLIRRALVEVRGDLRSINVQHVDAILKLCMSLEGHDRVIVPGVDALRSFATLLLTTPGRLNSEKRHYRIDLAMGESVELPFEAGHLRLEPAGSEPQFCATVKGEPHFPADIVELDGEALTRGDCARPLYLRNWEPGDEMHRPGHSKPEKLKALFQEYKVLLWERRHWPVVLSGDEIVWARRFGCAEKFQRSAGTRRPVRLRYRECERTRVASESKGQKFTSL
ncbi:MAG: tRNA lysidine(34) synthetase TilS, partial [Acidobacteriaceae bacterium]|nr:tRNA lysidine(34) synthetase TilS [Acidobacteriaceae bacterium]